MSKGARKKKLLKLLNTMYSNIVHYVSDDVMRMAEKNYYSTRDYALGDTVSCNAETALENCERIRGYYPATVPGDVFENIEEIVAEIRRVEKESNPRFLASPWMLLLVGGVAFFIYFILTHK